MRNKKKKKKLKYFPLNSPFFSTLQPPLHLGSTWRWRMGTLCLFCSFLFTFFPHSNVGYFPLNADTHKPSNRLSYGQQSLRTFSQGTTLQEQTAPEWVPHGRGVLTKICCLWPTFHGQEFLPESSPGWAFHGVTGNICLLCEPFMAFRAGICSSSVLHALQGNLCSGIWSILSPAPHLLHWHLCLQGGVLCQTFLLLSHRCYSIFLTFLKYVSMEVLPTPLISSAWTAMGQSWSQLKQTLSSMGELLSSSYRNCLCSPSKSNAVSSILVSLRYHIWTKCSLVHLSIRSSNQENRC